MPLPPMDESNRTEEDGENEPRFEFTYVESLMYAFHQLGRQCPEFLNDSADRLKDFRLRFVSPKIIRVFSVIKILFCRLQYFARGVQGYMKKLRESLHGKSAEQLKDDESRIKVTALRTTSNINTLIRDLFRSPPAYKASVTLSFKPAVTSQAAKTAAAAAAGGDAAAAADGEATGNKRHAPITFESSPPKAQAQGRGGNRSNRGNWAPYSVPTGKFSAKVNHGHSGWLND